MSNDLLSRIEVLQEKIKALSNQEKPIQLPPVTMTPNISRTSNEMWQIYNFELSKYESLQNLPSERKFLSILTSYVDVDDIHSLIKTRLNQLNERENVTKPTLRSASTTVLPLSTEDKIERAKLIAKHLLNSKRDPMKVMDEITRYQKELMELEEQYLEN